MLTDEDLKRENELAKFTLNICFDIHKQYGPGLFESVMKKFLDTSLVKQEYFLKDKNQFHYITMI